MKFRVRPSTNGQWYFSVIARNGRTLAHSETYWNKSDAKSAAQTIIREAGAGSVEE